MHTSHIPGVFRRPIAKNLTFTLSTAPYYESICENLNPPYMLHATNGVTLILPKTFLDVIISGDQLHLATCLVNYLAPKQTC